MKQYGIWLLIALWLTGCGTPAVHKTAYTKPRTSSRTITLSGIQADGAGREILMYTLGLLDLDYKFGGNNPEAGMDCSGMVDYIYRNAVGVKLPHNAAEIAYATRPVSTNQMRVGDLVFFNTLNKPYSHMGIYIGDGKFVHAPHTNSTIRVDRLDNRYFAARFEGARTVFE